MSSSVRRTAAAITLITEVKADAKDLSLKAKDMPHCPRGASRSRTSLRGLQQYTACEWALLKIFSRSWHQRSRSSSTAMEILWTRHLLNRWIDINNLTKVTQMLTVVGRRI